VPQSYGRLSCFNAFVSVIGAISFDSSAASTPFNRTYYPDQCQILVRKVVSLTAESSRRLWKWASLLCTESRRELQDVATNRSNERLSTNKFIFCSWMTQVLMIFLVLVCDKARGEAVLHFDHSGVVFRGKGGYRLL